MRAHRSGWLYLAIPLVWMRRKFRAIEIRSDIAAVVVADVQNTVQVPGPGLVVFSIHGDANGHSGEL